MCFPSLALKHLLIITLLIKIICDFQDVNAVAQDPSVVTALAENLSQINVLETDVLVTETMADMDHGAIIKVDTAPENILGNDTVSSSNFLPLHGISPSCYSTICQGMFFKTLCQY